VKSDNKASIGGVAAHEELGRCSGESDALQNHSADENAFVLSCEWTKQPKKKGEINEEKR
jgi:hypothetical protein